MRRTLAAAAVVIGLSTTASAHFQLMAPPAALMQDSYGDPQKDGPCGGAGTATNAITAVRTGSMLTITIKETITHPGHYRIAIAQTAAQLPAEPPITGSQCASTTIAQNPQLPLLADGVFKHTSTFSGPQTTQIKLPDGFTCDNCVLQVLEYMSSHAPPCFYHHCATVTISDSAPLPGDAGVTPGVDAGDGGGGGGGGCATSSGAGVIAVLLAVFVLVRRRVTRV